MPQMMLLVAAILGSLFAAPATGWGQSRRPAGEEWNQVRPLFTLVEQVAAGAPAPADVELSWQCYFVDADAGVVLVPFVLDIRHGTFTSFPLAMYVRVVLRGAPAPRPGPKDALAQYPFEDAAIVDGPISGRLSRAFTAPPGDYDVYIALTEQTSSSTASPKTAVVKQEVTVPDLKSGLTTSSVIVAEHVEADPSQGRATYEQQLDDPHRLWGMRITPATRRTFRSSEKLTVLFVVYQAKAASDDKPDVEVSYTVHRSSTDAAGIPLASLRPEVFNKTTLPPSFSLSGGDLILAGRQISLEALPAGAYRLEIVVTDNVAHAAIRRVVPFSVGDQASP
jgi:hypothetical protein